MRELTDAEYRAAQAILALPRATERERIRLSALSSSTYNVARRRIFSEGWLEDILIPNPGPFGYAGVELVLARPPIAEWSSLLAGWTQDLETVLLWAGVHSVFGVFYRRDGPIASAGPPPNGGSSPPARLFVERDSGSIPVYFDFSGLWARFGGEDVPAAYPAGLDLSAGPSGPRTAGSAARALEARGHREGQASPWTNFLRTQRPERRAVDRGVLQPRTVLDPARVPPLDGRRLGELLYVFGDLRVPAAPTELLHDLTAECHSFPLLLASAGRRVLLLGIGQTSARTPGRAPVRSAQGSVLATIERHLDHAEVIVEPVESIRPHVHHRYPAMHRASGREAPARARSG